MKNILLILIGFILAIGIGSAYNLNASLVTYDNKNTTLESENVSGALNELGVLVTTKLSEIEEKINNLSSEVSSNKIAIDNLNSDSSLLGELVPIGNTDSSTTSISIDFDLSQYKGVYAVGYAQQIEYYVGGSYMPKKLFQFHSQVIDYYNFWTGIVGYNDSTKKINLYSSSSSYSLYVYAIK